MDNADGKLSSNGIYTTDDKGEIRVSGIVGTIVVKETKTISGYTIDPAQQTQTVKVNPDDTQTLTFYNIPNGSLTIQKYIKGTKNEPLPGVTFKVTDNKGQPVGDNSGEFVTDETGSILIDDLVPGTSVTVQEVKTVAGYVLDGTPKTVKIKENAAQTLTFTNAKAGILVIRKLDKATQKPLPGAEFQVTYADGSPVNDASGGNGIYTTDANGEIQISGVTGAVVVKETKTVPGYTIDPTNQMQTVKVNPNDTQTLTFYNVPNSSLTIQKYVEGTKNEPLQGVTFKVTDDKGQPVGNSNGEFVTDEAGRILISDLTPGTSVTVQEIKTVEGYVLDGTPKTIKINESTAQTLTFTNSKAGTLVIRKLDKLTKKPLAGVEFQLTYVDGGYVDDANGHLSSNGIYTTDSNGEIRISGIVGTIVVKETKTILGYAIDPAEQTKTVKVNPADTQTLTFYNVPGTALTIQKFVTGTSTPIQGASFLVTTSDGSVVGANGSEYVTDQNGRITIEDLAAGVTVTAKEVRAASGYALDSTPKAVSQKHGQVRP